MGNPSIVRNLRLKCCVDTVRGPPSLVGAGRRSHPPVASATGESRPAAPTGTPAGRAGYSGLVVAGSRGSTRCSWLREVMASLVKTLPRWYWTVRALMNSRCRSPGSTIRRGPGGRSRPPGRSARRWCRRCVCGRSRQWPAARSQPARRTPRPPSPPAGRGRCASRRGRPGGGAGGAAIRRTAGRRRASSTRTRVRPSRSIDSRYSRSAASPSLASARTRAWIPNAHSDGVTLVPSVRSESRSKRGPHPCLVAGPGGYLGQLLGRQGRTRAGRAGRPARRRGVGGPGRWRGPSSPRWRR